MTPRTLKVEAGAPEYEEPIFRDGIRPTNRLYTPMSGEGVSPSSIVVIPDTTKSMYNVARNNNISDLYSIGSKREKGLEETSVPFVYRVELSGPKGEIVRFRSVFDDSALANAIDEKMYLTSKKPTVSPKALIQDVENGRWQVGTIIRGVERTGDGQGHQSKQSLPSAQQ